MATDPVTAALREVYSRPLADRLFDTARRNFAGRYVRIPIQLSPEARARRAWADAIAWLEAREAARVEWPWPERD
jgi:hypothetical protein